MHHQTLLCISSNCEIGSVKLYFLTHFQNCKMRLLINKASVMQQRKNESSKKKTWCTHMENSRSKQSPHQSLVIINWILSVLSTFHLSILRAKGTCRANSSGSFPRFLMNNKKLGLGDGLSLCYCALIQSTLLISSCLIDEKGRRKKI